MLDRTIWYAARQYPIRVGAYEAHVQVAVFGEEAKPTYDGNRVIRPAPFIQQTARVIYDGTDWDMPDHWVLIEWRGLIDDPLNDL